MPRNELEIVLRLRDEATRALKRAQGALKGLEGELKRAKAAAARLNAELERAAPASRALAVALAAGGTGAAIALKSFAEEAYRAQVGLRLFQRQLERMGQDVQAGQRELERIADRLGVLPQKLADYATQLLRQGLSMKEISILFEGAAASALAAGKDVMTGIDAVTNAIVNQMSVYLNYAGIAENLDVAYREYAKTLGKTVDALTKEERARAAVLLVQRATKEEVADLDTLLGGLTGKQNAFNKALTEFRLTLGNAVLPAYTRVLEISTEFVRKLQALPALLQKYRNGIEILAGAIAGALVPSLIQAARGVALFIRNLSPWLLIGATAVSVLKLLGVKFDDVIRVINRFAQGLSGLWQIGKAVFEGLMLAALDLYDSFKHAPQLFAALGRIFVAPFNGLREAIDSAAEAMRRLFAGDFSGAAKAASKANPVTAMAKAMREARGELSRAWNEIVAEFEKDQGVYDQIYSDLSEGWKKLADAITGKVSPATFDFKKLLEGTKETVDEFLGVAGKAGDKLGIFNTTLQTTATTSTDAADGLKKTGDAAEEVGNKAEEAAEKVMTLNEAIQRQLDLLGKAAPREAIGGHAYTAIVSPRGEPPTAGGIGNAELLRRKTTQQLQQLRRQIRAERNILRAEAVDAGAATAEGFFEGLRWAQRDAIRRAWNREALFDQFKGLWGEDPFAGVDAAIAINQGASRPTRAEQDRRRAQAEMAEYLAKQYQEAVEWAQRLQAEAERIAELRFGEGWEASVAAVRRSFADATEAMRYFWRDGELTKEEIALLRAAFGDLPPAVKAVGGELEALQTKFKLGKIGVKDYRASLEAMRDGLRELLDQTKEGTPEWQAYAEALERVEELLGKLPDKAEKTAESIAKISDALDKIQTAYSGLDRILSSVGKVGKDTGKAIRDLWGGAADLAKAIPVVGNLLSKVFNFFGTIAQGLYKLTWQATIESLNRAKEAYEKLGEQMVLIHQRAYAKIEKYKEKYLFGLIQVDRYKVEIDQLGLKIAQTLESGVLGGLKNAMRAFLEGAEDWQEQLKAGLRSAIEEAVIEAVIQGALIKGALSEMLTNISKAISEGNWDAAKQYIQNLADQIPELTKKLAEAMEPLKGALDQLKPPDDAGIGQMAREVEMTVTTTAVVRAPLWVDRFVSAIRRFDEATQRFANANVVVVVRGDSILGDLNAVVSA